MSCFLEIHTHVCKKIKRSFDSGTQVEAKRMHLFCPVTDRHTDTHTQPDRRTDCCNPSPICSG